MTEPTTLPRPRQVTVAAGMAVFASVLLVVGLFDRMSALGSPETRHSIADFLARPPGDGLGIDVAGVVRVLHAVVLVDGALAAAAAVLAGYSLFRHNGARIGLTVVAALLLFTAPLTGDLLSLLVALAAGMLWSVPARDWFAGRAPRPVVERRSEPVARPAPGTWAPPLAEERLDGPAAKPLDPAAHPDQPAPAAYPFGSAPVRTETPLQPRGPVAPAAGGRPPQVTAAAWLTWVFAGLTAAVCVLEMLMLVVSRDGVLRTLHANAEVQRAVDQLQLTDRDLIAVVWLVAAGVVFWSLSAMALALLAFRRHGWARVVLAVSCGAAGVFALTSIPYGLPHAVAAFATATLLFHPASNAWFAARRPGPPSYDGPVDAPQPPAERREPPTNVW